MILFCFCISVLVAAGYEPIVCIPVIPGANYGAEYVKCFGQLLRKIGVKQFQLLPYHTLGKHKYDLLGIDYRLKDATDLTDKVLQEMKLIVETGLSS